MLRRIVIVSMIGGALLLAACGGGSSSPTTSATNPGSSPKASGGARTEEFGMTEAELVSSIESTEAMIATCMSDAGFRYTPINATSFRAAQAALKTAPGLNDAQFVQQYGYGISTLPTPKTSALATRIQ